MVNPTISFQNGEHLLVSPPLDAVMGTSTSSRPDQITVGCDDNCPTDFDPGQEDGDGDGIGDACDPA